MIVCLCRNLNSARVLQAIERGVVSASDVHSACGTEVNCGSCLDAIEDMIGGCKYSLSQAAQ